MESRTLEIVITTQSTWPSSEELEVRSAVEQAVAATGVGICTGSGGGRGLMDVSFSIEDESKVLLVHDCVSDVMRNWDASSTFRIRVR